jgi:hypothetical protein
MSALPGSVSTGPRTRGFAPILRKSSYTPQVGFLSDWLYLPVCVCVCVCLKVVRVFDQGAGFRIQGLELRVWGLGFSVRGSTIRFLPYAA